jgi:hypothetical protein
MKVAIMQPYFLPYLGYFQLVAAVDAFVLYDDIKFTKQGWINRNRILAKGRAEFVTVPVAKGSDALDVRERDLAADYPTQRSKLERRIASAYGKAPFFATAMPIVSACLASPERNLFRFLHHTLLTVLNHLGVSTPVHISSSLGVPRTLRGQERVIATCRALGASEYVNAPGGRALYEDASFHRAGLRLRFLEPRICAYRQFSEEFVPNLSIIDVLMFNSPNDVPGLLAAYDLVGKAAEGVHP